MRIAGLIALTLTFNCCSADGVDSAVLSSQNKEVRGFALSPGRTCVSGWIDASYCEATNPKSWTQGESQTMAAWLSDLPASFLDKVKTNGFRTFFRYGHGFKKSSTGRYVREEPGAWVWGVDQSINFTDLIFLSTPPDPISGYDFSYKTVVHELAHAYDAGTVGSEFTNVTGWKMLNGAWVLSKHDMDDVKKTYDQVRQLGFEGLNEQDPSKIMAAMKLNREYGIARGFPTTYAMLNPSECFAEMLSHMLVDPTYEEYLPSQVVAWFKSNIPLSM